MAAQYAHTQAKPLPQSLVLHTLQIYASSKGEASAQEYAKPEVCSTASAYAILSALGLQFGQGTTVAVMQSEEKPITRSPETRQSSKKQFRLYDIPAEDYVERAYMMGLSALDASAFLQQPLAGVLSKYNALTDRTPHQSLQFHDCTNANISLGELHLIYQGKKDAPGITEQKIRRATELQATGAFGLVHHIRRALAQPLQIAK